MKRVVPGILILTLLSLVPKTGTAAEAKTKPLPNAGFSVEEDIRKRLGNFEDYQTSEMFSAGDAVIKIKAFNDLGWHIVVIPDKRVSEKGVTLKMKDAPSMEGYTFTPEQPKYTYWRKTGESVALSIMPEGWGWYFLRKPLPPSSLRGPGPKHLITTKTTAIKKAKYPVVDVHTHVLLSFPAPSMYLKILDQAGVAVLVDSPLATFNQQTKDAYLKMERFHPDRFVSFGTIDFSDRHQDDFSEAAIAKLESEVKTMGIAGVGETHDKGAGVYGHALRPDARGPVHVNDKRLMPVWRAAARLKLPILFHIAEPIGNYAAYGEHPRERWGTVSRKYNLHGTSVLSRDEMMRRRNSLMQEIPDLVIIGAHMGSLEDDLQRLADTFDKYPNFYVEIGQRHYALGQQPNQARKLFIKYQDRILFGQDGVQTLETYRNHFRFLETDDDLINFSSRRPPVYGLNLPDEVLRKVYYGNAAKLMPKVKKALMNQYPDLKFP
jgi:predicted TIM-barrel fold metal-dependent hydrolase